MVDVVCVLFWTQSECMVPNHNTRNIYHKQMNNGVGSKVGFSEIQTYAETDGSWGTFEGRITFFTRPAQVKVD